jgi:hypothetical protein
MAIREECGDNLHLDVRASTRETFDLAIKIAMRFHGKASAYCIDKKKGSGSRWNPLKWTSVFGSW